MFESRKTVFSLVTLAGLLGILSVDALGAVITTFTDREAFEFAVGGMPLTIEDFTEQAHFPISTGVLNSQTDLVVDSGPPIRPGDIQPGVTYSVPTGVSSLKTFFNIDSGIQFEGGFLDGSYGPGDANVEMTAEFDSNVRAVGFDTNKATGTHFRIDINFTSGTSYSEVFPVAGVSDMQFFGFVSNLADINSVVIDGIGHEKMSFAIDNFTFGVPEPTTFALLGMGILWLRKRRTS